MEIITALISILILATVVQFITDIIKGWLPPGVLKYLTPLIISAIIGITIAILFRVDVFAAGGYVTRYPIFAQIFTGIIISAGAPLIHELIAKLRESRTGAWSDPV